MNYIRTENKIIKVRRNKWNELVDKQGKYIAELEIIAQADTIEELCDLFVYTKHSDNIIFEKINKSLREDEVATLTKPLSRMEGFIRQGIGKYQLENGVYGAIWTSKGLIYVAKMNSNGEFELL